MSNPETEAAEAPAPHFRKTKQGKWAVMGPLETLQKAIDDDAGKVKVLKKNGEWSSFTVLSMGRPFDVDGVQMAYGYDTQDEGPQGGSGAGASGPGSSGADSGARSGSGGASGYGGGGNSGSQQPSSAPSTPPPPSRDEFEPLPEFQGGAEDEWQSGF